MWTCFECGCVVQVDHYSNALGEVPEWVFSGKADHEWKDYDGVYDQTWYENTYPSGESGM